MRTPWASIAKIEADGVHSGTGFLVTNRYVLTALHVVADKTGRPFPKILLRFNTNAEYSDGSSEFETEAHLVVDLWSAEHDFALLECVNLPPGKPLLLTDRCRQRDECSSPGFAIQDPTGFDAIGKISGLNDPTDNGSTAIGVQFDFGSGVLMKGHSGAALFVRERVVGFLRTAFLDEQKKTMGGILHATSISHVMEHCNRLKPGLLVIDPPIQWPAPLPSHSRLLADRREEFEIFDRMVTGRCLERVLLLKGVSGSGKSVLMAELTGYASSLGLPVAHADCKGCPTVDALFNTFMFAVAPGTLPGSETATGFSRLHAMIEDLTALDRPIVFALDTWQDSSDEVRKWIGQLLLRNLPRMPGVVVLIGGQKGLPEHKDQTWAEYAVLRNLEPITSVEDWYEYTQRKWPSVDIPKVMVETITRAVGPQSGPNVIVSLLGTLMNSLAESAAAGGAS